MLIERVLPAKGAADSVSVASVNFKAYFAGFFAGFFAGTITAVLPTTQSDP